MKFIALGTRYKEGIEGKITMREPFRVYAIDSVVKGAGMPPFYSVEGIKNDGNLDLRELGEGTQEYDHVLKWVGIARGLRKSKYGGRLLLSDGNNDAVE